MKIDYLATKHTYLGRLGRVSQATNGNSVKHPQNGLQFLNFLQSRRFHYDVKKNQV